MQTPTWPPELSGLLGELVGKGVESAVLPPTHALQNLELIDVQLSEGFGDGLVKMQALKKLLVIPVYKDEVREGSMIRSHS